MAKGKTTRPQTILVATEIADWAEWDQMRERGYTVIPVDFASLFPEADAPTIIVGPRCWRLNDSLRKYLDLAVAEGQKLRYPKKGKGEVDATEATVRTLVRDALAADPEPGG